MIAFMGGSDYQTSLNTISNPFNATLFLLLILVSFWHAQLGLQVVLEDYISKKIIRNDRFDQIELGSSVFTSDQSSFQAFYLIDDSFL